MSKLLKYICSLAAVLLVSAGVTFAQDTRKQEAEKAKLEREINIIEQQLKKNDSDSRTTLSDLTLIRKSISNRKALVQDADRKVRKYADSIYLAQREINRLKVRIDTLTSHYERLVRSAYKNRDAKVWYMYMFASENLGQAFRRFGYFRNLSTQMKNEAQDIRMMQDELEARKVRLSEMKKAAENLKAERVEELKRLRKDESRANDVVKKLKKDKKKYQAQIKEKRKEVNALNREISRIISEAMKTPEQKKNDAAKRPAADMALDGEFSKNKGKLPWPAEGPVLGRFGKQYHPVYTSLELPQNNGIDMAVAQDSDVRSVFDGVVAKTIAIPGYNQCVLVQHGNYFTLYCGMRSVAVKAGARVKTGDTIGIIDTINGQTQLHFEVWKGKVPQNPEHWLR